MFVDIVGASEVSNHKTPAQYVEFVLSFQDLFISFLGRLWTGRRDLPLFISFIGPS